MMSTDTFTVEKAAQYSAFAIFLHWVMAILIMGTIVLGWYMTSISDDPGSDWYFNLHKSIGIIIALLVLVRLAWRFGHTPAALPDSVPKWQKKTSRAVHWMLYICIVLMPILGLTGALFSRSGVVFFGLTVPRILGPDRALTELFLSAHVVVSWILVALICIHVLAGLKHLLINRDGVFQRMWF